MTMDSIEEYRNRWFAWVDQQEEEKQDELNSEEDEQ